MRKFLSLLGKGVLALLAIAIIAAAFIQFGPAPTYEEVPIPDLEVEVSPEAIERGLTLVTNNCQNCHRGDESTSLAGRYFDDRQAQKDLGEFYTANITQHPNSAMAGYTDGELYRLLRTGIKRNNEMAILVMPNWALASEQDIHDIIAFLRSNHPMVAPDATEHPTHSPSFLAKMLGRMVVKPVPYAEAYPERPALSDSIAYGKYQIDNVNLCFFCHSANIQTVNQLVPNQSPGYLGGGFVYQHLDHDIEVPGLIPTADNNMGKWSIEEFVDAVKYGQRPGLPAYKQPMHPYNLLDTAEVRAIHHYLSSLASK